jgi:hypothetical protein
MERGPGEFLQDFFGGWGNDSYVQVEEADLWLNDGGIEVVRVGLQVLRLRLA